jgi:hypothetical protein
MTEISVGKDKEMRKLVLRITLPLLLLAFGTVAHAQDGRPEFKMSCQEVLKLGLDKFTDVYGKRTQDQSTAGQEAAFAYYVNCKRPANDALATRSLTDEKRKQVDEARTALNKFGEALWTLRYAEEGGGTMWSLVAANAHAAREDFMTTFINALNASERKSARARQQVTASLARIQRWLNSPKRKPFAENSDPNDVVANKKLYEQTMKEAHEALAQLHNTLQDLPDLAAQRLAAQMAEETKNALADSP